MLLQPPRIRPGILNNNFNASFQSPIMIMRGWSAAVKTWGRAAPLMPLWPLLNSAFEIFDSFSIF